MAWFAVHTATGELVSIGTVLADPLPAGLTAVALAGRPDLDAQRWDETTRAFVARPAEVWADRLQDLADDPAMQAIWSALNATQRTALRNRLITLLGPHRYRRPVEAVDL